jgi:uracil permease
MESQKRMLLDVDEFPKSKGQAFILALQHVLAMFVACITVPLIVYAPYAVKVGGSFVSLVGVLVGPTIVAAGLGTLFYLVMTKFKAPMFLASSFAYMAPMEAAIGIGAIPLMDGGSRVVINGVEMMQPNLWILPVGMAMVGCVYCIVALLIKLFGVGWLNKLLPPIVVGPVIMVIGLSLATSAVGNLTGSYTAGGYNLIYILCGLIAMTATALAAHYGKGTVALIPFIIGMAAGYVAACIFTAFGYGFNNDYLKVVDFSYLVNDFTPIRFQSFLDYPKFLFLLGDSSVPLTWGEVGQAALLFVPVSFVTICEHIGDHKNMSGILDRDLLTDPGLTRTLIGDGVATAISGPLCGVANTTYGENVAVVGVTRIASTKVIVLACCIAIALGFLSPLMSFTMTIPACVTGGVSLILYGFIAASGVKMLINDRIDFGETKNIFVASVILVAGIGGLAFKFGNASNPTVEITSIAVSMLLGIIMNLILKDKKKPSETPVDSPKAQ